jgi:Tol biopolymer transport system component
MSATLVAAVLLATLVLASVGDATFAGDNGLIAFTSESKRVYTVEPDGSDVEQVTDEGTEDDPSFSPDGKTIVLTTKGSIQAPHLVTVDAGGGDLTDIPGTKAANDPTFSASGTRIAFSQRDNAVVTIDVDGGHPKTVVKKDALSPAFSPAGPQITYIGETKHNSRNVFTVDANGKHPSQLTSFKHTYADAPSFSPDGEQIVFSAQDRAGSEIWVMNANGSHLKAITDTHKVDEARPVFSPDGELIAYDDSNDIFTIDAGGGDPVQVTNSGQYDHGPAWQPLP